MRNTSGGPARWSRLVALTAALLIATGSVAVSASPAPAATQVGGVQVGGVQVEKCEMVLAAGVEAWCGELPRPWDPKNPSAGTLNVGFVLVAPEGTLPSQVPARAVVAIEGGPGYASTESAQTYTEMLLPLLTDRLLVVMDARGTGGSAPIACPALDNGTLEWSDAVAACGRRLGQRVELYSSAMAADDLAALLETLGYPRADVYGDSYGTFLAQVFAGRHHDRVRSLVLDGAYPVVGESAWYPTQGPALRLALDRVCQRSTACSPADSATLGRLAAVLAKVRAKPIQVRAPGSDEGFHRVRIDAPSLVELAFNGTYNTPVYRGLDASLGAALKGDWLPLGRLMAETLYSTGSADPVNVYSSGQATAVSCHDYPQLFAMDAPLATRREQLRANIQQMIATDPGLYGPFAIREYLDSNWAEQSSCLTWPTLDLDPDRQPGPIGGYPDVPTLVISGDLDTITTAAEGELVAAQFPRAQHLIVANGLHVNAMGDPNSCAATAVRAFLADSASPVTQSCALPAIRTARSYARSSAAMPLDEAVQQTVEDAFDRALQTYGTSGLGLRGGTWKSKGWPSTRITLTNYRLYGDLPVSGRVTWNAGTGSVVAAVRVAGRGKGRMWRGSWNALTGVGAAVEP
jgi:pimeloyl-ACP methyl ester carboxylesterase